MRAHWRLMCTTILLAGCGDDKRAGAGPPADTAAASVTVSATAPMMILLCGADTVSVRGTEDELQLHVNGESFQVKRSSSASGAKYQVATDSTTFYWNHGATSLVQVRGEPMPECETIPGA